MRKNNQQAGLVKLIILIIVAVLVLSYFGINIQKIAESDTGRANFAYVWEICQRIGGWFLDLYQKYLADYLNPILKYLTINVVK
ncbi:MAG TPA: hypothetical protein P5274_02875 [Candidatus Paceibacterota bacterium]|nr:hypothetical protein [Candidatus Paceibacterota bacterium]